MQIDEKRWAARIGFVALVIFVAIVAVLFVVGSNATPTSKPAATPTPVPTPVSTARDGKPIITIFDKGASVFASDFVLYTGLELVTDSPCLLANAPSGGSVRGSVSSGVLFPDSEQAKSLRKCDLQKGSYIMYADQINSPETPSLYRTLRFRKGQQAYGMVVLQDGTTYPKACIFDIAPMDGTVHIDSNTGSFSAGVATSPNGKLIASIVDLAGPKPFSPSDLPTCQTARNSSKT